MADHRDPDGNPRGEHARTRELLGPYVLGALDPEEEQAMEHHLAGCAACREEERELRETHERLAGASIVTSSAPATLRERIFDALPLRSGSSEARGAPRTTSWIGRAAVIAAVLLLFALAAVAYSANLVDRAAATVTLAPTELAPEAGGELRMRGSGVDVEAELEVWGLPQTGPNEYYELWFGRDEGRVSAGTFTVDDRGRGVLSASCPEVAGGFQGAGITLEEFPEEPSIENARVMLRGDLQES